MNKTENLLVSLAEECSESGQVACKAQRFGLDHIWPEKNETNRRILEREIADILGVAEELGLVIRPEDIAAKREKLRKYQALSVELGTLTVLKIKAAAVIHDGEVWTGRRHAHIMRDIWAKFGAVSISQEAQGFVTSVDKFVGREEAARIALEAGQIKRAKSELFSEDVFE